ncbi:MAG TPA: PadR family transcriptional regulator [Solirubrobacteraceae bacterium]|jgi:DNA-binding PadR family transcriptional regulator|nr:PadR family transcriptional regulator [Solirubrobacteraceae bacterium]
MSAKHAVLGLVIERPGYGYDLARRLRERFGSSGFAPTGVYSALDQLSAEGLVRSAGSLTAGRAERAAPRTIYEATAEGHEQFDRWMLSTSSLAHVRDELNMKLALSRPRDLPALIELARSQEEQCLARMEALKRLDTPTESPRPRSNGLAWPQAAGLLVRDAEVRQLQARIEWLQRVGAIMAKLAVKQRRSELSDESSSARAGCDTQVTQQVRAGEDGAAAGARVA